MKHLVIPRLFLCSGLFVTCFLTWVYAGNSSHAGSESGLIPVGAARVDITPDYPVRLSGYGSRETLNEGVEQKLWARALVIGDKNPVAVVTVDSIAVPRNIAEAAAKILEEKFGMTRARVVLAGTHSHSAPHPSRSYLPTIFGIPLTEKEWKVVDRYGEQMLQGIVSAVSDAMKARKPCQLSWSQGKVSFAKNRRKMAEGKWKGFGEQTGGAVDHALPLLAARDSEGKVVAMLVNYACHCTTISSVSTRFNHVCGDWAGYASDSMERDQTGAVGMVMIGCGADANPADRGKLAVAKEHGASLANEVKRLLGGEMTALEGLPETKFQFVDLPLEKAPSRAEIEKTAADEKQRSQVRNRAKRFLTQLDAGKPLATKVSLPVQTWRFGDDLDMVFLGGEVVVDYSLRLKQIYGSREMWVSSYCNDVPCYIPSVRILNEGGYEADSSMIYYAKPNRFRPELEQTLVDAITTMLPVE